MVDVLNWKARNAVLTKEQVSLRLGEVAGGTTAECAAVVCLPCGLFNLAVLALVKLPAGLSKKAWRKAKGKGRKRSKAVHQKEFIYEDSDTEDSSMASSSSQEELLTPTHKLNALVIDQTYVSTEKFWEQVVGNSYVGFWRNHSFRE